MMIEFEDRGANAARIKVIGVGGGGGNAVNTMAKSGRLDRVDFLAANSDLQDLARSEASVHIQLGPDLCRGLGCGADPEKGRSCAVESEAEVARALEGADMVFVTAGMGGGTGTGAAAVVSAIAKDLGALTVAVVTRPFWFEGGGRGRKAVEGIMALRETVDSLIVVPNDRLLSLVGQNTAATEAFAKVDEVLLDAVAGIAEIIDIGGLINVDFADVRAIMSCRGRALMGTGRAIGEGRAETAAKMAISSPLLDDVSIDGATGILINVTGSENLGLHEIQAACAPIHDTASPEANIIFGAVVDPEIGDEVKVTVIATGIELAEDQPKQVQPRQSQVATPRPTLRELPTLAPPAEDQWDRPAYARRREQVAATAPDRPIAPAARGQAQEVPAQDEQQQQQYQPAPTPVPMHVRSQQTVGLSAEEEARLDKPAVMRREESPRRRWWR